MSCQALEFNNIGEIMYSYLHESSLNVFVVPKKGFSKKYAVYATHYGSINLEFAMQGTNNTFKTPEGVAHFLEHKLFDQKDGNISDKFTALGAEPNAYTSFNQTVYLFSCTENFNRNFSLLLNFVQNPFFTEQSIEKERKIINQEIRMYTDNPGWRVFFNFLKALYKNNYVRNEILGNDKSIDVITKDHLYNCYENFYHPSNMLVFVIGDVNPKDIFSSIETNVKIGEKKPNLNRIFPEEPRSINKAYTEEKMQVSIPMFQMGFKDNSAFNLRGLELLKRELAVKILLEIIMGRSLDLYINLYKEGLVNNTFAFDYIIEENYAYSVIGGESTSPKKTGEDILTRIKEYLERGISEQELERIKNSIYGRTVRWFNSIEEVSGTFISSYFKGINIFDYFNIYDKINLEYVNGVMKEHFNIDFFALSVITPFL